MRVSLKLHAFLALAVTILGFMTVLYFVSRHFILKSFSEVEMREIIASNDRYVNGLKARIDFIDSKLFDWSSWDDSYEFVRDRNPKYLKSNYAPLPFFGLHVNLAAILDEHGKLIFGKQYGPTDKDEREFSNELRTFFSPTTDLIHRALKNEPVKGLARISDQIYLFSARPIFPTSGKGEQRGVLFFARLLDANLISELNASLEMNADFLESPKNFTNDREVSFVSGSEVVVKQALKDFSGQLLGLFILKINRPVYLEAVKTLRWIAAMFAALSIFVLLLISSALHVRILSRIEKMKDFILNLEGTQNFYLRFQAGKRDELDDLANTFNKLLEKICQAQHQLGLQEERYRLALSASSGGVWDWDIKSGTVNFDKKYKAILGYREYELGDSLEVFKSHCHPDDLKGVLDLYQSAFDGTYSQCSVTFRMRVRDGSYRWIHSEAAVSRSPEGEPIRMIGWHRDITEAKIQEELVEQQQRQIVQSSKLSALGQMAAGIAHEINNPLAVISGSAQLLQRYLQSKNINIETFSSHIQKIDSTVLRISKIVKSLRDFARDGSRDAPELIAPQRIIDDALSFCRERIRHSNIELREKINIDETILVQVRIIEISQIIVNLLNNAFDHAQTQSNPWVELRVEEDRDILQVIVSNAGSPISAEFQSKIFEPFFSTKGAGRGMGLGLSVSKGFADRNGSSLFYDSKSSFPQFILEIPIYRVEKSDKEAREHIIA